MSRMIHVALYLFKLTIAYICSALIKLFNPTMRNVWIISERGADARDNGYFFYRYMIDKHPGIPVFYVIKGDSSDAQRILPEHRIELNSFRHFLYFALCRVRISSHAWGGDIPIADYYRKLGLQGRSSKKVIFLQHGITKDYQPGLCYPKIQPNLFVCGAQPEYEYIYNSFKHPAGVVQYTGFARYDSLSEGHTKDQILVMPTFRKYLQGLTLDQFSQEQYFSMWQQLLVSPRVTELLEEIHMELIFYPHYEMQKYVNLFRSRSSHVIIADFDHYDVQTLLKESKLMITDFSSVFFDFSYMRKPVIFYQFDRERYIREHYDYTKGYFDYDTMAPGKVVFSLSDLEEELTGMIENAFSVGQVFADRRDRFFTKSDQHNCDRIYEAILKL